MRVGLLVATSLFVVTLATSATAQSAVPTAPAPSPADEDIVVTGSRIPRPTYDNAQPTITVSGATIEQRAFTSVAQALNEVPGFGIADSSLIGNQGNGFGVGQSFVNLYGLGSQRTLVLVNGRRFVGANPASAFSSAESGTQVDVNIIPTNLVERIEVVGIGGAPIYGADAIAGTVNFVLKSKFKGIDIDAQSGISQRGDLPNWRINAIGGFNFAEGRGNITVASEYAEAKGILGIQRDAIAAQRGFISPLGTGSKFQQVLTSNLRTNLGVPGGTPYFQDLPTFGTTPSYGPAGNILDANGGFVRFAPNGNLVPFNTGTATTDPSTFLGGDALNLATTTNLAVDAQRINTSAFLTYDLTSHIRAHAEAWYSKNRATNIAGQPVYNTNFFSASAPGTFDVNGSYIFRLSNPFLTKQAHDLIQQNLVTQGLPSTDQAGTFYVARANTDLVSGVAKLDQDLWRFVGGLDGDFQFLGKKWTWDTSINYGRTRSVSYAPALVEPNLRRALNVAKDASGSIVCAPFNPDQTDPTQPPIPRTNLLTPPFDQQYNGTISKTCAPLNLFGQGAPSQAARDYVTTNAKTTSITVQRDFTANVTGAVSRLPGGDLGVSLGYENRLEKSRFSPDAYYTTPFGRSIPINAVEGSYITNEFSGEVRAPLIGPDQHIPLVRSLELNGAARYVDNSVAGGDITWTAGGRYAPIRDLAIRGNFTHSIRAPGVAELFSASQPAFDGGAGSDPCDQKNIGAGPNSARRQANCTAAGIKPGFTSNINSFTIPINIIGGRNLKNETANSWTAGGVLTPRFLPRFTFSSDYISIDIANVITASSAMTVLNACYDSAAYPNDPFCGLFKRDANGQVTIVNEPYINEGSRVYRAVQTALDYSVPLSPQYGKLVVGVNWQHVVKAYTVVTAASGPTNARGQINLVYDYPVDQVNLRATFDYDVFSWFNEVRFISASVFNATEPANTRDISGVGAYAVWNTSVAINIGRRATFQVNVDNVTDRSLPYPASGNAGQNVYSEGLFGRTYLAGLHVRY